MLYCYVIYINLYISVGAGKNSSQMKKNLQSPVVYSYRRIHKHNIDRNCKQWNISNVNRNIRKSCIYNQKEINRNVFSISCEMGIQRIRHLEHILIDVHDRIKICCICGLPKEGEQRLRMLTSRLTSLERTNEKSKISTETQINKNREFQFAIFLMFIIDTAHEGKWFHNYLNIT